MRRIKQAGFIVATLFLTLFIACGGGDNDKSSTTTYTVLFISMGGNPVQPITGLQSGTAINAPSSPSRAGYTFGGWATSSTSYIPVSFPYQVTGDVALYAIWNLAASGAIEIRTQADLENIRNDLSGDYVLAANITLTGNWEPIGTRDDPFEGTFDGGAYTISGMKIITLTDAKEPAGFFGYVYGAEIYNLHLTDVDINVETYHAGGIAGYAKDSLIIGCDIEGSVFSDTTDTSDTSDTHTHAGGIAGYADNSKISGCYIAGDVTAYGVFAAYAGGIAGRMEKNSVITDCVNDADVYAEATEFAHAGGIAGYMDNNSLIDYCDNYGNIGSDFSYNALVGGIAGYAVNSEISDCYNNGVVDAEALLYTNVGGIVGSADNSEISGCYNDNTVSAFNGVYAYAAYVGGITGYLSHGAIIVDCGNDGDVYAEAMEFAYAGGIAGISFVLPSGITDCYNNGSIAADATNPYADEITGRWMI